MYEIPPRLPFDSIPGDVRDHLTSQGVVFAELGDGEFGCHGVGYGHDAHRYFVKFAVSERGVATQHRAIAVHARVRHPTLVPLIQTIHGDQGPVLVFPWVDAAPLRQSQRMRSTPLEDVLRASKDVIDVHRAIEAAGFVSIDLYDGNLLYNDRIHLIDVDEYSPSPFILDAPRTLGSTRFMAPEEFLRGASLDSRTMVFQLGRTLAVLLDPPTGNSLDRCPSLGPIIGRATAHDPEARYQTVAELADRLEECLRGLALTGGART